MWNRTSGSASQDPLDPALVRMARLEGLAASSYRFAPNIVTLAVTVTALQLGTDVSAIRRAVSIASLAAVVAIAWELRRLRRGAGAPVGRGVVLASFLATAAALGIVAFSPNAVTLAVGMALMGFPLAVNARFRHAAMARFHGFEGSFQEVAHRWNRVGRIGLVLVVGAVTAVPVLGWRWAAVSAALWFALLGLALHRASRGGSAEPVGNGRREERLTRQWRLASVKRHAGTMLLASAIMQLALSTLEPALHGAGLRAATLIASVSLAVAQLGVTRVVGRIAKGANHSARRMALRASWWFPLAAPAALLVSGASRPLVAIVGALAWMAVVEVGFGGAAATTRVGLGRVGQLASLLGALAGYAGTSLGSLLPAIPGLGLGEGWALAATLLAGALLSILGARWAPRHGTNEEELTSTASVKLHLKPHGERAVAVRLDSGEPTMGSRTRWRRSKRAYRLDDADRLQARVRFDARPQSELIELVRLVAWVGAPGPVWRLLAWLRGRIPCAGGIWPLDVVPFAAPGFAGFVRWTGPGVCGVQIAGAGTGRAIILRLPADERGRNVGWRRLAGSGQDDPAPQL